MIRLTTTLLTLGVSMATATAQWQNECFYGSCDPEASWCRLLCGSGPQYKMFPAHGIGTQGIITQSTITQSTITLHSKDGGAKDCGEHRQAARKSY